MYFYGRFNGFSRIILIIHVKCRVKVQNNLSEPSGTLMGLRQQDALFCILQRLEDRH
jgi:hypothetical protein